MYGNSNIAARVPVGCLADVMKMIQKFKNKNTSCTQLKYDVE